MNQKFIIPVFVNDLNKWKMPRRKHGAIKINKQEEPWKVSPERLQEYVYFRWQP